MPRIRNSKSASDKAQAALAVAERKVASLDQRLITARLVVTGLNIAYADAVDERDYLAQNPALPSPPAPPNQEVTGNAGA